MPSTRYLHAASVRNARQSTRLAPKIIFSPADAGLSLPLRDGLYIPGRSTSWLRWQVHRRQSGQEVQIMGLRSLLVLCLAWMSLGLSPPPVKCEDTCVLVFGDNNQIHSIDVSSDGECDDGGSGSEYHYCQPGTDCTDCSPR